MSSRFKPSHRLNLLLVPADPERELDEAAMSSGLELLRAQGYLRGDGPGERDLAGGFALIRVDRPPEPMLYGNRQGGFHVRCPCCGENLVSAVPLALRRWRAGAGRELSCFGCDAVLDLAELDYAPVAAPGRFALELRDVGRPELEELPAFAAAMGGPYVVVGSRG